MRLTEKKENGFYELKKGQEIYGEENGIRLVQIVGEYEDIEEELGIDLITLHKLFHTRKIYSYGHTSIMENSISDINIYNKMITIWNGTCHSIYPLSEYGKSFALTKEELQ